MAFSVCCQPFYFNTLHRPNVLIFQHSKTRIKQKLFTHDRRAAVGGIVLGALLLCGCQSANSYAKLEQELRGREAEVRTLQSQIADSQQQLKDQDQQLAVHRTQSTGSPSGSQFAMVGQSTGLPADGASSIPEEVLAAWGSVTGVQIQKLVSGIQWDSGQPVLHLVIRPVDTDGELRKVAGQLSVRVQAGSDGVGLTPLAEGTWTITESRELWSSAFVSSGFHVRIPIENQQAARNATQLIVKATLQLGQGRTFEVTETIHLPVSSQ